MGVVHCRCDRIGAPTCRGCERRWYREHSGFGVGCRSVRGDRQEQCGCEQRWRCQHSRLSVSCKCIIQDLVLVASAFGEGAAAPSARAVSLSRLTVSDVEGWLIEARVSIRSGSGDPELQSGRVGQERLILTSFSRQTHILSDSGSGEPELQIGSVSRRGRSLLQPWDCNNGEPVASGVYFYTLTAGDFAATRKMLILK